MKFQYAWHVEIEPACLTKRRMFQRDTCAPLLCLLKLWAPRSYHFLGNLMLGEVEADAWWSQVGRATRRNLSPRENFPEDRENFPEDRAGEIRAELTVLGKAIHTLTSLLIILINPFPDASPWRQSRNDHWISLFLFPMCSHCINLLFLSFTIYLAGFDGLIEVGG